MGGGWCYDEQDCFDRSKTILGSSETWARTMPWQIEDLKKFGFLGCMNALEDGSMDSDCNTIFLPYCDGASFSGFRSEVWSVPSNASQELHFRGLKNFDATIDFAFENGLGNATEFVLSGQSAGGLATFLHADRVADRLAKQAPDCTLVRAVPIDVYFLEHLTYNGEDKYPAEMKYVHHMQNLTSEADGLLLPACEATYPENKHYCFMSPHMNQFVKTPFFMFNSKYDFWQLSNVLQTDWKTAKTQSAVIQYGQDFMEQFMPVQLHRRNGALITSCLCHGCPWTQFVLEGKTAYQHYADWYYGKTRGRAAIHIDAHDPNGGGSFDFPGCEPFPYESIVSV